MPEKLLTIDDVSRRLGVASRTVRRHLTEFQAGGLQMIHIGGKTRLIRFRESSLDQMIKRAAERELPLLNSKCGKVQLLGAPVNI